MVKTIKGFFGQHRWLSNFYLSPVTIRGKRYTSSEAAYQSLKTVDMDIRKHFTTLSPKEAKSYGRRIEVRHEWGDIKVEMMELCLRAKFMSNPTLRQKLVSTGNYLLVEYNTWGDTFWGVTDEGGKNTLGKLLMNIRRDCVSGDAGAHI